MIHRAMVQFDDESGRDKPRSRRRAGNKARRPRPGCTGFERLRARPVKRDHEDDYETPDDLDDFEDYLDDEEIDGLDADLDEFDDDEFDSDDDQ